MIKYLSVMKHYDIISPDLDQVIFVDDGTKWMKHYYLKKMLGTSEWLKVEK